MRIPRKLGVNRPNLILNVVLGVVVLAAGGWAYQTVAVGGATDSGTASRQTATVTTGVVSQTVSASGSVSSARTANISFITSGTVTEVDVKVGDVVKKGQVLAKVDSSSAEDNLATAKANRQAAEDALARAEDDASSNSATISSAKSQVTSARATVNADQKALDGTVLKATMAGTVTAVNGSVGNSSSAATGSAATGGSGSSATGTGGATGTGTSSSSGSSSTGFVQLADLSRMQATADFAEADATKVKVGQTAGVTWSALSGTVASGKVKSISPTATTSDNVNSYEVNISVVSVPKGARIGQTVTAKVTTASAANVLRVPTAAVRSGGGVYTVQVPDGSQTQVVTVQVGVPGDTYYEIKSGLSAGQTVVLQQSTSASGGGAGFPNFPGGGPGGGLGGGLGGGPVGGR